MELIINAFLITLGIGLGLGVLAVLWTLVQIVIVGVFLKKIDKDPVFADKISSWPRRKTTY
jgi:hypothetical protein